MRQLIACALALSCVGCVSAKVDEGPVVGRYLGLVEVRAPAPDAAGVVRKDVRVLGGWLEVAARGQAIEALGVGWRESRQLIVPADCRLVVIVRSEIELASVRALLRTEQIKEGELCVVPE